MRTLLTDGNALSDALHELTHFHSLANPIGAVFSTWSFLYKLAADDLAARIRESRGGIELSLARCLNFGMRMEQAEEEWRPFLEGMAIYAQTSAPCTYLNEMILPLDTLRWLEVMVTSLDPPADLSTAAAPQSPMIEAGEQIAARGAELQVNKTQRLAEWIELSTEARSLPYFVGHAYIRALQAHLRRATDDFDCAQTFLGLVFRILRGSWTDLVGRYGETIRNPGETIPRLYAIPLEIFAEARPDEVRRLLEPGFDVDVLKWLGQGRPVPPQQWNEEVLSRITKEWFAAEWGVVGAKEDDLDFLSGGLQRLILHTQVLNMTSGGTCNVRGFVPSVEGATHACALDVDGATWWLLADDAALQALEIRAEDLFSLPADAMRAGSSLPNGGRSITLQMHSFLRYGRIGGGEMGWFLDVILKGPRGDGVVASVGAGAPGLGRAVLRANVQDSNGMGALKLRDELRALLETPLDCPNLSDLLERRSFPELAAATRENWAAHCARQLTRREKINREVLQGLLSTAPNAEYAATELISKRMGFALVDHPDLRDLLVSSYAAPALLVGQGATDTAEFIRAANAISEKELGKPVFEVATHPDIGEFIRYLGIWERPA